MSKRSVIIGIALSAAMTAGCGIASDGVYEGVLEVRYRDPGVPVSDNIAPVRARIPLRIRMEARPDQEVAFLSDGCVFRTNPSDVTGPPWSRSRYAYLRFFDCTVTLPDRGRVQVREFRNAGTVFMTRRGFDLDAASTLPGGTIVGFSMHGVPAH